MAKTVSAAPKAAMLIESMRDIGYDLEAALADVIDNAITAGATTVRLLTSDEAGSFRIAVLDDGCGMDASELISAMTMGSRNPLDERDDDDLGRFGLGLKTASFSQCRRLTVVSCRDGVVSGATWDLDYVAEVDDWLLTIPDDAAEVPWASELGETGTLVLWEKLDRLVDGSAFSKTFDQERHLVERLDDARQHLELVFHRFLAGEHPARKIEITLNGSPLEAFDPFNANHPATQWGPIEKIRVDGEVVTLRACTLPHFSKVTQMEWDRYGGRAGYLKNQGFYLYRANRLIIHGTWFGLARQTLLTQLSRVRIDMPTGLDARWKIDVKKSHAQPPLQIRVRLQKLIEKIGAPAKRVFTGKAQALASEGGVRVWERVQSKGEITYRLNPDHPVVSAFAMRLPEGLRTEFSRVLELVASTIPLNALAVDLGTAPEIVAGSQLSDDAFAGILTSTMTKLLESGLSTAEIPLILRVMEPFQSKWDEAEALLAAALSTPAEG